MTTLTIAANIIAKQSHIQLVKNELLKLIEITRLEDGCINYDLYQDNENKTNFMFYENWESKELWQQHMNNDHLKSYVEATQGAVDSFIVNEMSVIS